MINVALIYLVLVLIGQAAPGSLRELLGNPDRFYEQPVIISGTVSNVRESGWRRPLYTFDLSDGTQTVRVIAFGKPACRSGAATVEGTFGRMRASYEYEITARSVICLPDSVDPRGPN